MTRPVQNCALLLASLVLAGCANQSYVSSGKRRRYDRQSQITARGSTLLNSPRQATRSMARAARLSPPRTEQGLAMKAAPPTGHVSAVLISVAPLTPESGGGGEDSRAIGTRSVPTCR